MIQRLILGFECVAADGWEKLVPEVSVPKNYKRPEIISEYITKRMHELEAEAPGLPFLGRVMAVCVLNADGDTVFHGEPGDAYAWLGNVVKEFAAVQKCHAFYGAHVRRMIHQLALTQLLTTEDSTVPLWGLFSSMPAIRGIYELADRTIQYCDPITAVAGDALEARRALTVWMDYNSPLKRNSEWTQAETQANEVLAVMRRFNFLTAPWA